MTAMMLLISAHGCNDKRSQGTLMNLAFGTQLLLPLFFSGVALGVRMPNYGPAWHCRTTVLLTVDEMVIGSLLGSSVLGYSNGKMCCWG
jgi:hypothetical protein